MTDSVWQITSNLRVSGKHMAQEEPFPIVAKKLLMSSANHLGIYNTSHLVKTKNNKRNVILTKSQKKNY